MTASLKKGIDKKKPDDFVEVSNLKDEEKGENGPQSQYQLPPTDKGYAWIICLVELGATIATWGLSSAFGVFISFWLNNNTFSGADPLNYALSSSITVSLGEGLAPISMICKNILGLKITIIIGIVFSALGAFFTASARNLWELYCSQGLLLGIGFGLIFNSCIVVLSQWFIKYRALTSGIATAGAGLGGVVFSLAAQALINKEGDYRWAMRMIAIVSVTLEVLLVIFIKERTTVKHKAKISWKLVQMQAAFIFRLKVMFQWRVVLISLWCGLGMVSYIVISFSLASFATFIGLSETQGANVTAIFNGCQVIGRPLIGIAGDKFGRVNMAIFFNAIVIILIFAFFINCHNSPELIAFSILSGLTTGCCQSLNQAIMPDSINLSDFPSVWSSEGFVLAIFCIFSDVVALKLRDLSNPRPFLKGQIFSGFMTLGSLICILPLREWKVRKRLEENNSSSPLLKKGVKCYIKRLLYAMIV